MVEVARKLGGLLEQFAREIEGFRNGGPNLKAKNIAEAVEAGVDPDGLANLAAEWDEAIAKRPKLKLIRRLPNTNRVPDPLPPPEPQQNAPDADEEPQIDAALQVSEKAQARAEPEEDEWEEEELEQRRWAIPKLEKPPVLTRKAPMDWAKAFARDMLTLHKGDLRALGTYFFRGEWWQWDGSFYEQAPRQRVIDLASSYLDKAKLKNNEEVLVKFKLTPQNVRDLVTLLESCVGIDDREGPPRWLDERAGPEPGELLAFKNCLVNVRTGETFGHDPRLWAHDGLDFDYDERARCPKWQWFLEDIHPGDEEAQMAVEEWLGYGMTWDNRFEKIALWVGEPRSGRGTIASIQELLVGPTHHIPLNIHTWNNNENSKEEMIGKKVGIFHDVRLKEPKQFGSVGFDPGGLDIKSIEALLEFSSGDAQAIGRKFKTKVVGRPKIKLLVLTNKILNLRDDALLTRLFLLYFGQSRVDREDKDLKLRTLPSEISGIAWRCLAAYRRLRERDKMLEPKCGLQLVTNLREQQNAYFKFMNRFFVLAPEGCGVRVKVFLAVFRYWAREEGRTDIMSNNEGALLKGVHGVREWKYLKWTRHNSEERVYPVAFKADAVTEEMANTIKIKDKDNKVVLAHELLDAVRQ